MQDLKVNLSAHLGKQLQAALTGVHLRTEQLQAALAEVGRLKSELKIQTDANLHSTAAAIDTLMELDTCKETVTKLQADITKLQARVRELEST